MGKDQFAARATIMVGAEEQAGERVGINVALETHPRPPQHVQDGSVSLIMRRGDRAANGALGKFAEPGTVQPQPRKVAASWPACTRPRVMCRTSAASREMTGVRGKSRKSAPATASRMSCRQRDGEHPVTSNVVH